MAVVLPKNIDVAAGEGAENPLTSRLTALELARSERAARCRFVRRYQRKLRRARRVQVIGTTTIAFLLSLTFVRPNYGAQALQTPLTTPSRTPQISPPVDVFGTRTGGQSHGRTHPKSAKKGLEK